MHFGRSVKKAMIDKDISCKELAAQLEVNDNTVSNWRKNETQSGQVMQKLADFFEMTVSELVSLGE